MSHVQLKVKRLHPDAVIPAVATEGAAGFDLHAVAAGAVTPGKIVKIPLGLAFEVPPGYCMQLVGRSGNGMKYGAGVAQGYGLIDSDYRGEVCMLMRCDMGFAWGKGDRICQAVILPVPSVEIVEADELSTTERGSGGFGSTGK